MNPDNVQRRGCRKWDKSMGSLPPAETKCQVALKDGSIGLVQKDRGALWVEGAAQMEQHGGAGHA